jgi:dihydropteroate synthase
VKDTILRENKSINCGGKLISLDQPIVMGIINITPDSFYDGGKTNNIQDALAQATKHIEEGATIIDIGGYSSRPGAANISIEEEINRVTPIIETIRIKHPEVIISIDTFRSEVAKKAIEKGAHIVNDISAGELDDKMFKTVADLNVPYIMMHMKGNPQNMQEKPQYENILLEITNYFSIKIEQLISLGVKDIIIDPGFGFGKTVAHNYNILKNLSHFKLLGLPILVGLSRKSMLYKPLNSTSENALNATTAAHMIALQNGAKILRVHDVKEAMEAIKIFKLAE